MSPNLDETRVTIAGSTPQEAVGSAEKVSEMENVNAVRIHKYGGPQVESA
jgi:hypothetical protein